jgi:hypothetical protein
MSLRVDAHDGILAAVRDPCRAVGADDDAVRRRARSQRNFVDLAGLGIENAELARALRRVVDGAAGLSRRGDIMRSRIARNFEVRGSGSCRVQRQRASACSEEGSGERSDPGPVSIHDGGPPL